MLRSIDQPDTCTEPCRIIRRARWKLELLPRAAYTATYTPSCDVVGFAFDQQTGIHAFASDKALSFDAAPNGLAAIPSGCDVYSESPQGGEYLKLSFDKEIGDRNPIARQFSNHIDQQVIRAAHQVRRIMLGGRAIDALALPGLVQRLRDAVGAASRGNLRPPRHARWLTPYRERLLNKLIEENIAGTLTVQMLAMRLGISPSFLSRAFSSAAGKPLYDYILDCRIARARQAVIQSAAGLAEIALSCGFSSHAHLTTTFTARLGVSPQELRRHIRRRDPLKESNVAFWQ